MRGMLDGTQPSGSRYYHAKEALNEPPPIQDRLPILVGGGGERKTLRIVAQYADACNLGGGFESVKRKDEILRRHCEEVGRDESEIERTVGAGRLRHPRRPGRGEARSRGDLRPQRRRRAVEQPADRHAGAGRRGMRPFADIGFRHFIVGFPSPYDAETMERLVTEVKPMLARLSLGYAAAVRVTLLAGGTGGTKLAHGFAMLGDAVELTVIANVADDIEIHGLHVSPGRRRAPLHARGLIDAERGWGVTDDTFTRARDAGALGGPAWFSLGDADLATHVERTRRLREGESLTDATAAMAAALGIRPRILPSTDDRWQTRIETDDGELDFQEYFVHRRQEPVVRGVRFDGDGARPTRAVIDAIATAELVVIGPSNPIVSIGPILELPGVRDALRRPRAARWPSARSSAAARSRAQPTGCSRRSATRPRAGRGAALRRPRRPLRPRRGRCRVGRRGRLHGTRGRVLPTVMRSDDDRRRWRRRSIDRRRG